MTPAPPTVALIHATPAAMAPARAAFAERFPRARLWNLLDDLLISEAEAAGRITPPLRRRMEHLIQHARDGGADAVLLTCSMYGSVAHGVSGTAGPLLASDDALFAAVAGLAPRRVVVLGPIPAGVQDTVSRLAQHLDDPAVSVDGVVVDGAAAAAAAGDQAVLEARMVQAAREAEETADVIVIGQFSLTPAASAVSAAVSVPVLSPPHLAAETLRARLTAAGPA